MRNEAAKKARRLRGGGEEDQNTRKPGVKKVWR
jgi:hypothetical protein